MGRTPRSGPGAAPWEPTRGVGGGKHGGAVPASRVAECVCTVDLCCRTRETFGTLFRCSRVFARYFYILSLCRAPLSCFVGCGAQRPQTDRLVTNAKCLFVSCLIVSSCYSKRVLSHSVYIVQYLYVQPRPAPTLCRFLWCGHPTPPAGTHKEMREAICMMGCMPRV